MRFINSIEPAELSLCDGSQSFLQSGFWGSFKARFGWNARAFLVDWAGGTAAEARGVSPAPSAAAGLTAPLLLIRRRLGPGVSFAYVPWGPELPPDFPQTGTPAGACFPAGSLGRFSPPDDARNAALAELALGLRRFLPRDTAFIRFDPPWYTEGSLDAGAPTAGPPIGKPFTRSGADVQPPDTVIIDLSQSEEAILAAMKPTWRRNIHYGPRKGVTVRRVDAEGIDIFYTLLKETAKRDGIAIHGVEYYRTLFAQAREYAGAGEAGDAGGGEAPKAAPELRLYLAEYRPPAAEGPSGESTGGPSGETAGETLAAIVVLVRGKEAVYLYGASSSRNRNLMAPHALQWQAMRDARAAGCLNYDLFGIPPNDDPAHPMAGLYRFKTGFGGRIIHRPGSWDYTYRPLVKGLFTAAEGLRKSLRSIRKLRRKKSRE
ncbi:peptidoglycan bridge formation protein FemAB [Spirochaetia bacterium]|nr:peptidoglycan bridge formation protein FemAB [Spirochaetia bacterium]